MPDPVLVVVERPHDHLHHGLIVRTPGVRPVKSWLDFPTIDGTAGTFHVPVIHHIELAVTDGPRAVDFYAPVLTWLGFRQSGRAAFVKDGFLLLLTQAQDASLPARGGPGLHHLSFAVPTRADVDRFYAEVLQFLPNVRIEDPPVDCPEYRYAEYYATFFFDPDGTKLEVVFTQPGNEARFP